MAHANHATDENADPVTLTAEEMQVYGDALAALRARQASAARLEVQLRQERLAVQAIDRERARIWVHICRAHGMDPEGGYTLDDAGQVFAEAETTTESVENTR